MTVRVRLFGPARDALRLNGSGELMVDLPERATVDALLMEIVSRYPALGRWKGSLRVAVNRSYAGMSDPIGPGDEVAVIPPVSGG